jgi:hypothetical protein
MRRKEGQIRRRLGRIGRFVHARQKMVLGTKREV